MTTYYRLTRIDLSTRLQLATQMMDTQRPWGTVTALANNYQVSRKFLYQLEHKANHALMSALTAQSPGPKPISETLLVDDNHIQRAIITLATIIPGSVRSIQTCLQEILDTHRSMGFISQWLNLAGKSADELNQSEIPKQLVLGEADEIFQGRHPCLTVVDGRTFAVLQLSPQKSRDADTWGVCFLELQERGIQFADIALDGARGISSGIKQAGLTIPLRPDLFHLLRESSRLIRRLESSAYKAIEQSLRVQQADKESSVPNKRVGRPLEVHISLVEAKANEQQAIEHYDLLVWLQREIRQSLEPYDSDYKLTSVQQSKETLDTAISLLCELGKSLGDSKINDYVQNLAKHREELMAPLEWLEQQLSPYRQGLSSSLSPDIESVIIWSYKHQQELGLSNAGEGFPEHLQPIVKAYWEALSLFHRSSSLAESLHSFLRPYFDMHRVIPEWLPSLLQYHWNHHEFQRGKRKGNSPLGEPLTWSESLDRLMSNHQISKAS
jgi:hypothetical protein